MSLGTIPLVSATTGVPVETIRTWKKMPWWKEIEQQIKDEDNQELDTKFSKIIRRTLDTIEDRLENGNFQLDPKTGRVLRVPVNLRDSHRVLTDLVDKRKVIRNEPTVASSAEGVNDRLVKLAAQFAEFALSSKGREMKQEGPVYEGDWVERVDTHAVHEEGNLNANKGTLGQDDLGTETILQRQDQEASTGKS